MFLKDKFRETECVNGCQGLGMIINGHSVCFTGHKDVLEFNSANGYTTVNMVNSITNCVLLIGPFYGF